MRWWRVGVVAAFLVGCGDDPPDPTISLECRRLHANEQNDQGRKWGFTHGVTPALSSETSIYRRSLRKWCEDRGVKP